MKRPDRFVNCSLIGIDSAERFDTNQTSILSLFYA